MRGIPMTDDRTTPTVFQLSVPNPVDYHTSSVANDHFECVTRELQAIAMLRARCSTVTLCDCLGFVPVVTHSALRYQKLRPW